MGIIEREDFGPKNSNNYNQILVITSLYSNKEK